VWGTVCFMKITESGPHSISQVARHYRHGNLFLSPEEYQRESAWDLDQKKLLIDTIFQRMDVPKFYLWKIDRRTLISGYPRNETHALYAGILEKKGTDNEDPDPYVYEVVDGQQRIRTILEYMGDVARDKQYRGPWLAPFGGLPTTPVAKDRLYSSLNPEQQLKFDEYPLSVIVLEDCTIDQIREMFLRLQNGTPLNAQQKRDAMGSDVGAKARMLSELPFFARSVAFSNDEGDHRRVASQMLLLEYRDRISPSTSQRLDKLYAEYRGRDLDTQLVRTVKTIVDTLGKMFPERNPSLNRSYALALYWVMSRVRQNYTIRDADLPRIRANFKQLEIARIEARDRDYERRPEDDLFEELSLSMSHGTDGSEKIETRHDILLQFLFAGVALEPRPELDTQRDFSHEEKLILYHRANGTCQLSYNGVICGRKVPFEEAAIDHVMPHSRGGKTELTNGRYAHRKCNIARGTRDDFDPATACLQELAGDSEATAQPVTPPTHCR
jgi:hypothetical protein